MRKIEYEGKTAPQSPPSPDGAACPGTGEPVFRSSHSALRFAFNFSHGTLKKTFLAAAQPITTIGRGLGGLDGAAQAGMILAHVMELHELFRHMLTARFTVPIAPCSCRAPCCSGSREDGEWRTAIDYVTQYVLAEGLTGTISHYRLRRALVKRYFLGKRENFKDIAGACGVHRTTASQYHKAVVEGLEQQERLAMRDIDERLVRYGIVEPPEWRRRAQFSGGQ